MSFRSTLLAFGLLLGMLWLFGLMLSLHTGTTERDLVLPSFFAANAEVEQITIENREPGDDAQKMVFTKKDGDWRMRLPPVKRSAAVEESLVDGIVSDIRSARQSREAKVRNDLAYYGLDRPSITVTLHGKDKSKPWQLYIGKKSPDKDGFVYVNSSDRSNEVLAAPQSSLRRVFVSDPASLRVHTLLDTTENSLQWLRLTGVKSALELQRTEGTTWRFITPELGYAEWQGPDAEKLGPVEQAPDGVRGLATALAALRVEKDGDFLPLNDNEPGKYGLSSGNEEYRFSISNDAKGKEKQTLLIGVEVPGKKDRYYARLESEEAPVIVDGKKLKPILQALKDPESLRSRQLVHTDLNKIDAIEIRSGKELASKIDLRHKDDNWQLSSLGEPRPAFEPAIKEVLAALAAQRQIKDFIDVHAADSGKTDMQLGLDHPTAEVKVWLSPVKEAAKDGKEKKDVKPAVVVAFGNSKDDLVYAKRTTADGLVSRFTLPRAVLDKLTPATGGLAFLDRSLPGFSPEKVTAVTLTRSVSEVRPWQTVNDSTIEVSKGPEGRWRMATSRDGASRKKVEEMLGQLTKLEAREWVQKIDAKADLAEFGLKDPALQVTVQLKDAMKPQGWASAASLLIAGQPLQALAVQRAAEASTLVYSFGKQKDNETYAMRSGSDIVFRVSNEAVQSLTDVDLRDRFWLTHFEPALDASIIGMLAGGNVLLGASPLMRHQVANVDATQVKELRVAVRRPEELRRFTFARNPLPPSPRGGEGKRGWIDKTGLEEFEVDSQQVERLVQKLSHLRATSFVQWQGDSPPDMKLGPKEASLRLDLVGADNKTLLTVTIGAAAEEEAFYAQASTWPEAVFTLATAEVEPLQRGTGYFGKTRVATR